MSSSRIPPPTPPASTPLAGGGSAGQQVVKLVMLPERLQVLSRAIRLEGVVVEQNPDGTTRIKTPEGEMDVLIRGRQLQPGTRVEIDIPTGSPPRQATVRPLPPLPQQPQSPFPQQAPPLSSIEDEIVQVFQQKEQIQLETQGRLPPPLPATSPRPQTSLPLSYQPIPQGIPQQNPERPPLMNGQIVRLIPIPPAQAQAMIQQSVVLPPESLITVQLPPAVFTPNLSVKTEQYPLQNSLQEPLQQSFLQTIKTMNTTSFVRQDSFVPIWKGGEAPLAESSVMSAKGSPVLSFVDAGAGFQDIVPVPVSEIQKFEHFIQNTIASPRLLQFDVKILDVKPPFPQMIPTVDEEGPVQKPVIADVFSSSQNGASMKPAAVMAVVTGFTPQHLPLVTIQWPSGTLSQNFVLQFPAGKLEVGSRIIVQPQMETVGKVPLQSVPLMEPSPLWPVLDEIYQSFSQATPQAVQMMARVLPSPVNPSQFGPAALLFIAAVNAGDISNWLGEKKLDLLTRIGKTGLLSRLMQDAGTIARANMDVPNAEWRSYPLPLLWQGEISKVIFHVRHERQQDEKDHEKDSTRFILDLSLPRMGEVQIDGLLRGKRLDLVIRTQLPVSLSMQQAMKRDYAGALEGTDLYGEITFQGDLKHWVHILKREEHLGVSA